eukprot:gb/GEZN01010545.1/.p1 GENE.gb/GEZN01010545.1/~~gb/GEZN01010545.1/.p1  ORF type:complete len:315 (+),score=28.19 gb/GEZN01010545.1/:47-991(+)
MYQQPQQQYARAPDGNVQYAQQPQVYGAPARAEVAYGAPQAYGTEALYVTDPAYGASASPYGAPAAVSYDPYAQQQQVRAGPQYAPAQQVLPYGVAVPQQYGAPLPVYGAPQGPTFAGGNEVGSIKFFNQDKKFGFIIPVTGGREIHFKGDAVRGDVTSLASGTGIQFTRMVAPDGKCWADNVYPPIEHKAPPVLVPTLPGAPAGPPEPGSVKFFEQFRKFGFIIPASGGRDVHFKGDIVVGGTEGLVAGTQVTFTRRIAVDGKCWAETVTPEGATAADGAEKAPAERTTGKRKFDTYGSGGGATQPGTAQYDQ